MNDEPVVQPPLPPRGGTRHPGRKRYPAAVRLKAVRLHLEAGFPQPLVCQEMAIGSSSLAVWVSRYRQFGEAGLQPQPHAGPAKSKLPAAITEQIVALKQQHPTFGIKRIAQLLRRVFFLPASPNVGVPNWIDPRILMIPRHANNLFFNVSTPAEWTDEYNHIYRAYWGRDLSYAEILDNQAELLLGFLLKGDVSPLMFHQPNLRDYNGLGNTLLGDLLDAVANKYERLYNFPALSPTMNNLAVLLQRRQAYNESGVLATRNANNTVTLTVTKGARIPVTGLVNGGVVSYTGAAPSITAETYAGQRITYVTLAAGASVTLKRN